VEGVKSNPVLYTAENIPAAITLALSTFKANTFLETSPLTGEEFSAEERANESCVTGRVEEIKLYNE
jgi:hypothetical protein